VRHNDICIIEQDCPCYGPDGQIYNDTGRFTIPGEDCKEFECVNGELNDYNHTCNTFCPIGYTYNASAINPLDPCCGKCEKESEAGKLCELFEKKEKLVVRNPDAGLYEEDLCETPGEVNIKYCHGQCGEEHHYGAIVSKSGITVTEEDKECRCCSGVGYYEEVQFQCTSNPLVPVSFQVKQMETCNCYACEDVPIDGFKNFQEQAADGELLPPPPLGPPGGQNNFNNLNFPNQNQPPPFSNLNLFNQPPPLAAFTGTGTGVQQAPEETPAEQAPIPDSIIPSFNGLFGASGSLDADRQTDI